MGGGGTSMGRGETRERKGEEELLGQGLLHTMCAVLKVVAFFFHIADIKPPIERRNLVRHSGEPLLDWLGREVSQRTPSPEGPGVAVMR